MVKKLMRPRGSSISANTQAFPEYEAIESPVPSIIRLERLEFLDTARLDELFYHTSLGLRSALEGVMKNSRGTGITKGSTIG